jgi:hypothetical protein
MGELSTGSAARPEATSSAGGREAWAIHFTRTNGDTSDTYAGLQGGR